MPRYPVEFSPTLCNMAQARNFRVTYPLVDRQPQKNFYARHTRPILSTLLPGILVLTVYVFTLAPTVTGEDSGELITAAYFFGVPHPPGYPLWTILCGSFIKLVPFGTVAWRANLFSAVCMAAAVIVLAATLRQMRFNPLISGIVAVISGLTGVVWSQSVISEVYTLHLLLLTILFWMVACWQRDQQLKWLAYGSLALGLGMANHHLIGFGALGLGVWVIFQSPGLLKNGRLIAGCAALFVLGLSPYVYLLWAGGRAVPVRWGETGTLASTWEHVSRGQYKCDHPLEAPLAKTAGLVAGWLYYALRWEVKQFTPMFMPLLAAGQIWLWRRRSRRPLFWWVLTLDFCCGPLLLYEGGPRLDRQDQIVQQVFLLPLAVISTVPLAAGLHWMLASSRRLRNWLGPRLCRRAMRGALCSMIAVPLFAHGPDNNMRNYWYAHDHAQNILTCLLPDSIIFPSGDHNTFPLLYLIYVEGIRSDVTVADKYGYIDLALYRDMPNNPGKPRTPEERDEIERWIIRTGHRPVYYTIKKPPLVENAEMIPVGLVYHLLPDGKPRPFRIPWESLYYRNLEGLATPEDLAAMNIIADYYYSRGMAELVSGNIHSAKTYFGQSLHHAWGMKEIYNNVASALAEFDQLDDAIGYYEEAAKMQWDYTPARWNLAKIFKSLGKYDWSAKVFEDLTRATPGDFRPYGELGFLYRDHLADIGQARYWWLQSLRRNPDQEQIILALADHEDSTSLDCREPSTRSRNRATTQSANASDQSREDP